MRVDIVEEKENQRKIFVDLEADEVTPYFDSAYKRYRSKATVPGYRKGKAPKAVVERMFKKEIEADAIDDLVRDYYGRVLDENDIDSIGSGEIQNIDRRDDGAFSFEILVEVIPEFTLDQYKDFDFKRTVHTVDDQHVQSALDRLREDHAVLKNVDREAGEGDVVLTEIQILDEGGVPIIGKSYKDRQFLLKKETLEEDLYNGLVGMKNGDQRNITVRHSHKTESGEMHDHVDSLRVTVTQVQERSLPELDDEFARDLGVYENLDQLKDKMRAEIKKQWDNIERQRLSDRIIDEIIKHNEVPVPDKILERYLNNVVQESKMYSKNPEEVDEEYIRNQYKPTAIRAIKWYLSRKRIAEIEEIKATDDELRNKKKEIAESRGVPVDQLQIDLDDEGHRDRLTEQILEDKVVEFILSNSNVEEVQQAVPASEEEREKREIVTK